MKVTIFNKDGSKKVEVDEDLFREINFYEKEDVSGKIVTSPYVKMEALDALCESNKKLAHAIWGNPSNAFWLGCERTRAANSVSPGTDGDGRIITIDIREYVDALMEDNIILADMLKRITGGELGVEV